MSEEIEKTAFVIGGARTIGAASAARLAGLGYRVAVADRDLAGAQDVVNRLDGKGHESTWIDVTDERSVVLAFQEVERKTPGIHVLVSCAGGPITTVSRSGRLVDLAVDDWDNTYSLNARGTFLVLREMLRLRQARPLPQSRIVTIASIGGQVAWNPTGCHYTSSKAAVISMTKFAAIEAAPLGMTVNAIAPGAIDGPNFRSTLSDKQIDDLVKATPISRLGTAAEVAAAVAWLASEEAGYITGATIDINGGRRMA